MVIHDFFDKEKELEPVKEDISRLVDDLAHRLHAAGKITGCVDEEVI